ncbi:SOS response-associated peptidase [Paremcibacter congregatus]|uniref:SOS response-associated peptidase n=1 Tax=Paremcibacter congregatus TaxID=2043170 RepID=UPI0030EC4092|tara:strand:+ start:4693 stop:5424 length:732 start_codon:yes stop_codon:yes gene_type:complete
MCGRYTLSSDAYLKFMGLLGLKTDDQVPSRFNIAPMQPVAVIRVKGSDQDQVMLPDTPLPGKEMALMQWGLVPSWAKEMSVGRPLINARSETIADKPSFRSSFRRRKCLVPASGFYEWKRGGASPVPYHVSLPGQQPFAFAAIWEVWMGPHGDDWWETVCLVTKPAIPSMKPVHHRSPVIIDPVDYDRWLMPCDPPDREIFKRLSTLTEQELRLQEVSGYVNNVRHDGAECIAPAQGSQFDLF